MKLLLVAGLCFAAQPWVASAHPSAQHTIEALSESIRARPGEQELYIRRGQAYSNEGQLELALADLRRAEGLGDPLLVAFDLGVLHYRMGRLGTARRYFDVFLERFPDNAPALEYRARVSRDAGDHEAALADFEAYFAVQKQPNPGDYLSAAQMLAGLEGRGVEAALAMLDEGMDRLGIIPQLQGYAVELERGRGNIAAATVRLETLRPALGDGPDWKVDMGELLFLAGRPDQARPLFEAAAIQLSSLRSTAARRQVQERLAVLQASLSEQASTPEGLPR